MSMLGASVSWIAAGGCRYGTMALARGEFEANSGSSQVFWLLKVCWLLQASHEVAETCRSQSLRILWLMNLHEACLQVPC